MALVHDVTTRLATTLAGKDEARIYPGNPGAVQGAVVREGTVTALGSASVIQVSVGGGTAIPIRYIGACPPVGAKVLVVFFGQIIYCLGATSDLAPMATPYRLAVYLNAAQSFATGVDTEVLFNVTTTDPAGGYNSGNGRYTCPVSGIYLFDFSLTWALAAPAVGNAFLVDAAINGTTARRGQQTGWATGMGNNPTLNMCTQLICHKGDTISAMALQGTAGAQSNISGAGSTFNYMNIFLLGQT